MVERLKEFFCFVSRNRKKKINKDRVKQRAFGAWDV